MKMKTKNKGFTLIELLVVVAIIGLLSTMAVVALNGARKKSRDAIRVADVKQIQTALEMYMMDQGSYPIVLETNKKKLGTPGALVLSAPSGSTIGGFTDTEVGTVFMGQVPADPGGSEGFDYFYYTDADGYNYTIQFGITGKVGGALECSDDSPTTGCCVATQDGITCGANPS